MNSHRLHFLNLEYCRIPYSIEPADLEMRLSGYREYLSAGGFPTPSAVENVIKLFDRAKLVRSRDDMMSMNECRKHVNVIMMLIERFEVVMHNNLICRVLFNGCRCVECEVALLWALKDRSPVNAL